MLALRVYPRVLGAESEPGKTVPLPHGVEERDFHFFAAFHGT